MRKFLTLALLCLLPIVASCTPTEVAFWQSYSRQTSSEVQQAIHNPHLACIRYHESDHNKKDGPLFMAGKPTTKNPGSSAGGFYQWVDGTWEAHPKHKSIPEQFGYPQYAHTTARDVPADVQHIVTLRYVLKNGTGPWRADHC